MIRERGGELCSLHKGAPGAKKKGRRLSVWLVENNDKQRQRGRPCTLSHTHTHAAL